MEQRRQAMLQLHLSDQQSYCLLRCGLYKLFYCNQIGWYFMSFITENHSEQFTADHVTKVLNITSRTRK